MKDSPMTPSRLLLAALATLRLTRFITSDYLGEWAIVAPLKRWAVRDVIAPTAASAEQKQAIENAKRIALDEDGTEERDNLIEYGSQGPHASKRARLVKGLDCPFCVGFWIGALVLLGEVATRLRPLRWARPFWTFTLGALGLNYIVGHISSRID